MKKAEDWVKVTPQGLYIEPGDFYIDPVRPVERALITHGHADHARRNNKNVLATAGTIAIMKARYGTYAGEVLEETSYGYSQRIGDVTASFHPAGHVLGSAQILLEHEGCRVVVSGDYKRQRDPTCAPFEPISCDVFITEATFGLPVFCHPPAEDEVQKLLASLRTFPESGHLVGVYALGKCQRLMALLKQAGWDRPIYIHGAMLSLTRLYDQLGIQLGDWIPVSEVKNKKDLAGQIVLCPPSALDDRWSRRIPDVIPAMASGWMRVRGRARQRGVELPLIISDHADWPELLQTIDDVGAPEVWITHGREEALMHAAQQKGYKARALALVGFDEEGTGDSAEETTGETA
jgi:putative mRNA 3-end processing factor